MILRKSAYNPYYILATIYGEQNEFLNTELNERNSQLWNAWACQNFSEKRKEEIKLNFFDIEIPEWTVELSNYAKDAFSKRCSSLDFPDPSKEIDFKKVYFTRFVSFRGFLFPTSAIFDHSKFTNYSVFSHANFLVKSSFTCAEFNDYTAFDQASFNLANFCLVKFNSAVDFNKCRFGGPTNFHCAKFSDSANFSEAVFNMSVDFKEAIFERFYPILDGTYLHPKTMVSIREYDWPRHPRNKYQSTRDDAVLAAISCANLRYNLTTQGMPDRAHFFFQREMMLKAETAPFGHKPFYFVYENISKYGQSVVRPILYLFLLWLLGAMPLWLLGKMCLLTAFGLSFSNIFRFFGFQRIYFHPEIFEALNTTLQILTAAQTFLGYILLFFLGLGLRNTFRLK